MTPLYNFLFKFFKLKKKKKKVCRSIRQFHTLSLTNINSEFPANEKHCSQLEKKKDKTN